MEKSSAKKTSKEHLREMIGYILAGEVSLAKESFDKTMLLKTSKLIKRERCRIANLVFNEGYIPRQMTIKEGDSNEMLYNKLVVRNSDLFQREKQHMPDWMQEADPDGVSIEPIKEKDAIDLSSKFHSVEFTSDAY